MKANPSAAALFSWPSQGRVGKVVPKSRIYERAKVGAALRQKFITQVDQIVWQYKLAPETINLHARTDVPEIQVFRIELKGVELSLDVLRCIDGAVQFPIVFELEHDGKIKVIASYKRPSEADASKWVISDYFSTAWVPATSQRGDMPVVLDLGGLYEALLLRLIPLNPRAGESLAGLVERLEAVRAKKREIEKIGSKLTKEKQFNRKVNINADLRDLKSVLEELEK
jgi:hypothetical protein